MPFYNLKKNSKHIWNRGGFKNMEKKWDWFFIALEHSYPMFVLIVHKHVLPSVVQSVVYSLIQLLFSLICCGIKGLDKKKWITQFLINSLQHKIQKGNRSCDRWSSVLVKSHRQWLEITRNKYFGGEKYLKFRLKWNRKINLDLIQSTDDILIVTVIFTVM